MITSQQLIEQIQKNVGVPWQSQRSDGFSDGILFGSSETTISGIVTTFTPTLDVLRKAQYLTTRTKDAKELLDNDPVWRAKQEFISKNNLVIIRLFDNWDARQKDGQLRGLSRALGWDTFHLARGTGEDTYDPRNVYFRLPTTSLNSFAEGIKKKLNVHGVRVIGKPDSSASKVALTHGLLLVADAERILREPDVDVIVTGDAVEWEAAPYFQDMVAAGKAKGLILLGDEASEEPGSGEMAEWLKGFVTEVPIEWIPAGEPFWVLS